MELPKEFLDRLKLDLGDKFDDYIKSFESKPVRGIRVNTKKIGVDSFKQNFSHRLREVSFADDGFILDSDEKLGNTPEHLSGQYYFQEPSSMLSVCASQISGNVKVLDLCASPGGKTGQIACRTNDGSIIISNEIVPARANVLFSNIERQGFKNVIVTNNSPEDFDKFDCFFDYVFVDAPCSGEGMFRKNPDTILEWSTKAVESCSERQKQILAVAKNLVKPNGILVYSTCTFSKQEDEEIVKFLIDTGEFEIEKTQNEIKKATISAKFDENYVKNAEEVRKFFPFSGEGEGQFVAVLRKINAGDEHFEHTSKKRLKNISSLDRAELKIIDEFIKDNFSSIPDGKFIKVKNMIYLVPNSFDESLLSFLDELKIVSIGVKFGAIENSRFEPHHMMFMTLYEYFKNKIELSEKFIHNYLHGEELDAGKTCERGLGTKKGYGVILVNGLPLGGVRISQEKLKNILPKGLRL